MVKCVFDEAFHSIQGSPLVLLRADMNGQSKKFYISGNVLEETLQMPNAVIEDRMIAFCEKHRSKIEEACHQAAKRKKKERVELIARDFA